MRYDVWNGDELYNFSEDFSEVFLVVEVFVEALVVEVNAVEVVELLNTFYASMLEDPLNQAEK